MNEEFDGYRPGDVTYCVLPDSELFFPVRVSRITRSYLEVIPLHERGGEDISPTFEAGVENRRFRRPKLPPSARFGGCDERLVNSKRVDGVELRLLPTHYATFTNVRIRELHQIDPDRWPLPTGLIYERWFR
ncbi:MAG: hypothetical protein K0Q72_4775 [Armatimonadetes bacterium]|jgi:hypothetical protein|nr:hypothetical protein [Armatimonadota bacterium]